MSGGGTDNPHQDKKLKKREVMIMSKKMTKKEMFEQLKNTYSLTESEIAFIDHEIELLERKNKNADGEKKMTATQKANAELKVAILDEMVVGKRYRVSEITNKFACTASVEGITPQKVSALVRQLVADNLVERVEDKRVAYFVKVGE